MATALVTGASSGVGRAIAEDLAAAGHQVLALGRNAARLAEVARTPGVEPLALDLADRDGLAAALAGREIGILVNNAGVMPQPGPFQDAAQADIDAAIAINFAEQVALTRLVLPPMVARRHGHVVFTGSTAGHAAFSNMAVYCATKAALGAFAQALRLDVAQYGVRITEIVAGRIETGLYEGVLSEEQRAAMYAGKTAVQPGDVAQMVRAVLAMPSHVNIPRFDILPARQPVAG